MWNDFVKFVNAQDPEKRFNGEDSGPVQEFFESLGKWDLSIVDMQKLLNNESMEWVSEVENHWNSIQDALWIDDAVARDFECLGFWATYGDVQDALEYRTFYEYIANHKESVVIDPTEYDYDEETEEELVIMGAYVY